MEDAAAAAAGGPQKTVVLDVVALSRNLISAEHTPFLHGYLSRSDVLDRNVEPAFPALTCPAQSTYLSGTGPVTHGITANVRCGDRCRERIAVHI